MKNIETILSEAGIEIPEDKKETINKAVLENYKTIAEYNKVTGKRDEYKKSLDEVQGKLEDFKDVDLDDIQGQIKTLTGDLQAEKDARAEDARKNALEKNADSFLTDKTFVNDLTRDSIRRNLIEELDKDTAKGKSVEDIFKALTSDEEGKPLENILVSAAEKNKAKFTVPAGKTPPPGQKLSATELMKLKNENPDLDITQYM